MWIVVGNIVLKPNSDIVWNSLNGYGLGLNGYEIVSMAMDFDATFVYAAIAQKDACKTHDKNKWICRTIVWSICFRMQLFSSLYVAYVIICDIYYSILLRRDSGKFFLILSWMIKVRRRMQMATGMHLHTDTLNQKPRILLKNEENLHDLLSNFTFRVYGHLFVAPLSQFWTAVSKILVFPQHWQ